MKPSINYYSNKLAETIIKRYPDPDTFPYRSWSYSQGFMLWGMEKLWEYTNEKKYYDYIMAYVNSHVDENGNIPKFSGNSMDDMMTGSIIVWAYNQTKDDRYKKACKTIRDSFDIYPRNSNGGFWHGMKSNQFWVDGVFMGEMFLTKYGKFIDEEKYCFNEAAKQLTAIYELCHKDDTGLILHAYAEGETMPKWANPETGLSPEVWSEGLGWYALILAEAYEIFPKDHESINDIASQYRKLMESLKEHQDKESGLWYQVVDKGDRADNWRDTSGSAMFLYSIMKAVELGIVDEGDYTSCIDNAYSGIVSKARLNDDGLLDIYDACDGLCVQVSYDVYINYKKVINAKEAVAAFLWATVEYEHGRRKKMCKELGNEPKLFALLPDYVCTPDGMAIDKEGNLILSCPNFADDNMSGCLVKIDKDKNISKWVDVPVLHETGIARNMGIAFDSEYYIYICDNQGWSGKPELQNKGRILKLKIEGNEIIETTVVAYGMEHPNGIRIKGDFMYVTQSLLSEVQDPSGLLVSCVYRFNLNDKNIEIKNNLDDKNILTTFITLNKECQYGADGIEFGADGNLYVGNFGDGAVHRIVMDDAGFVTENKVWAKNPTELQTTDGIVKDEHGNLYVADFSANAIAKITPGGVVKRIAQSPDSDGFNGELDQPGEPIVWQGKLIVSCFDLVTGPDKINTGHELPATLSELALFI